MSPYAMLGLLLLAVAATVILALAFSRRKLVPGLNAAGEYIPITNDGIEPATAGNGYHFVRDERVTFGKRGYAPARQKNTTIFLTPRQIERVNIQRKLRGKPPFNRKGLTNAIAHPFDRRDVRQPQSSNDWLSYLIAYEIFFGDHQSHSVSGCGGVTIDTSAPYNGHGGEYAGAGASGSWGDSLTRAEAAAIDHGVPLTTDTPDIYAPVAASVSDSAPSSDPSPSYSAPDPSPSYSSSSDSSSSYSSSDSSSSSSFDSGSSGGGGGD